jgi:antirestriction protein
MVSSVTARLESACASHSGGEHQGFFYIDGIPTKGLWIDLGQVGAWEDIQMLLSEAFPDWDGDEVLCADVEGLAKIFYSSSCDAFSLDAWVSFFDDVKRSHLDEEVIQAYADSASSWEDVTIQNIEDSYMGQFDSDEDFAEDYAENSCLFEGVSDTVRYYFDFEHYWKAELRHYFYESNGYYFRNL